LGEAGLHLLREVADEFGLGIVTEVMAGEHVPLVASYADVLQIGSRNAQNFELLRAVAKVPRAVLLKRGMMSTLDEYLLAAEYILAGGNPNVILCERGIRTFEPSIRNTFDVVAIPALKERTHLPVIADPSHATGKASLVEPAALAAVAAGAHGLLMDVHSDPEKALCDGAQALLPSEYLRLVARCLAVHRALLGEG
jgi:3-deoxy-7-phosphoheptulonate synthase